MEGEKGPPSHEGLDSPTLDLPPPPPLPEGGLGNQPTIAQGYEVPKGTNGGAPGGGGEVKAGPSSVGGGDTAPSSSGGRQSGGRGPEPSKPTRSANAFKQATRGSYGDKGRPVMLECNYFETALMKQEDVYHYDVRIAVGGDREDRDAAVPKKISRDIMAKLRSTYGLKEFRGKHGAYDGEKSLFTSGPLDFNSQVFPVFLDDERGPSFRPGDRGGRVGDSPPMVASPPTGSPTGGSPGRSPEAKKRRTNGRGREFDVRIEFAARISMSAIQALLRGQAGAESEKAQDALRVLDIVLREVAATRGYLLVRDNFFHPSLGNMGNLGEGVEAWRGFHSSIRATAMGLALNLDITMTTVIKPMIIDELLMEKFNLRDGLGRLGHRDWSKVKTLLKGVRVETTHMRVSRTHKILGLSSEPIGALTFIKKMRSGNGSPPGELQLSVIDYYWDTYKYRLKYPDLPALNVGSSKKPTWVPLELCKVLPGQRYTKALSRGQRQKQIDACKQTPQDRKSVCERAMKINNYDSDKIIKEFGLQFNPLLAKVKGRILDAPTLSFGRGRTEVIREGRWNFNNKMMTEGVQISNWAVAVFDQRCPEREAANIADQLMHCCNKRGMKMEQPCAIQKEQHNMAQNFPPDERVKRVFSSLGQYKPTFILAILADKDSEIYVPLKKMCETVIGVISQCMVKPRQLNDQYLGNLALKINLKLGGYNSILTKEMTPFLVKPTIIFGMDVSHGSPGDADSPSIAAVVASKHWPTVSGLYASRVRAQPPKMEMIQGLHEEVGGKPSGMIRDLLIEFYNTCSRDTPQELRKPAHIIVYRDGVSESQFDQCLDLEVTAFVKACQALEEGYRPMITFIVAQKRHNTRFFPTQGGPSLQRTGNVIPGTIIDRDVCHPHTYDFFLCSHNGLIGTTRPTHYHILHNENSFSANDLQQLTNHLCYTFSRCTTAVAVAAPAAYAHLVATRFRKLLDSDTGSETSSQSRSREGGAQNVVRALPPIKMSAKQSMFFC